MAHARHRVFAGILALTLIGRGVAGGTGEEAKRPPFAPGTVGFTAVFQKERSSYRVLAVFVLPGEEITFGVEPGTTNQRFEFRSADGAVRPTPLGRWRWTAPFQTGPASLSITETTSGEIMRLTAFVMVPSSAVKDEQLNGYRIGVYPKTSYRNLEIYRPPRGFVEVTEELRNTPVSPHFTLGQFLCKQQAGWPRYLVLRTRLLLKLELLLEKVNQAGFRCDTFTVMSGYRTPFYNELIGNVKYSRHQWGGAADIFIDDDPADGIIDDLNRDGRINIGDAHVLYEVVDREFGKTWYEPYVGGLGAYRKTPVHGPFVHVDARGFRARWGD